MFELLGLLSFWSVSWFIFFLVIMTLLADAHDGLFVGAVFCTIFTVITFWWIEFNPFIWVYNNPGRFAIGVISYFTLGVGWSFFKWDQYVAGFAKMYHKYMTANDIQAKYFEQPKLADNKIKVVNWVVFWWASFLYWVFDDMLNWIGNQFVNLFHSVYDKIGARHYKR